MDTCIVLRTALIKTAQCQAGAGIVADSDLDFEQQECINKAKPCFAPLKKRAASQARQTRSVTTVAAGCLTPLRGHRKPLAKRWNMIVLIDNYDSFTFNLFHYLGGLGADVVVHRNDKISVADVMATEPDAIVLSPGPCTPNEAGICLDLIAKASATIPILGVCLATRPSARLLAARWRAQPRCMARYPKSNTRVPGCFAALTGR
jgi:carbamoylphosphate synthase small subunit